MKYTLYKLVFQTAVHFGNSHLDATEVAFCADTLFSALCQEALKLGRLDDFVGAVKDGKLLLSDAFPYTKEDFFLPKPYLHIASRQDGDSSVKKAFKNMSYVPAKRLERFLKGTMTAEETHSLEHFGTVQARTVVSVRGQEEPEPYRIGTFWYAEGCGLYLIVGSEDESQRDLFEELMDSLTVSGIGGKRASGYGKFEYYLCSIPSEIKERLEEQNYSEYMTLCISLPAAEELENSLEEAQYMLVKRSGFVASDHDAQEQRRKKDLYMVASGSCFKNRYHGDVYDVSSGGSHPVLRYGKPLFMGVNV